MGQLPPHISLQHLFHELCNFAWGEGMEERNIILVDVFLIPKLLFLLFQFSWNKYMNFKSVIAYSELLLIRLELKIVAATWLFTYALILNFMTQYVLSGGVSETQANII